MCRRVVVTMVTNCINIAVLSRSVLMVVWMIQTAKEMLDAVVFKGSFFFPFVILKAEMD
jgi:hypothetical protein